MFRTPDKKWHWEGFWYNEKQMRGEKNDRIRNSFWGRWSRSNHRRSRRASRKQSVKLNKEFGKTILKTKVYWPCLEYCLKFCSVVNPLLTSFDQHTDSEFICRNGHDEGPNSIRWFWNKWFIILLIGLIRECGWKFYHFGVLQFIALLIAGVYFYKIIAYFSRSEKSCP